METGDGKWDNPIAVEFTKDNIEKSQTLKKGDRVTIEARVNGREWQGRDGVTKWFTSISAYKLETEGAGAAAAAPAQADPDSSSYDTYDEYDDGVEDEVF